MHQIQTDVYERDEDEENGLHIKITNGKATSDSSLERNPSPRRQGLTITLQCESCRKQTPLSIWQHKGKTYLMMGLSNRMGVSESLWPDEN